MKYKIQLKCILLFFVHRCVYIYICVYVSLYAAYIYIFCINICGNILISIDDNFLSEFLLSV